jgi:FkbM family methyltransferase
MSFVQQTARRLLPASIRKPLGYAAGKFNATVIQTIKGAVFDLTGGRFRVDGCEFIIPKDLTSMSYRACFLNGSYEAEERELVRDFLHPSDTVLELGACLGIISCIANKLLADKSRHVVVEGNPFCIPSLHRNRELNECGFLVENCAVSNQRAVTFYLHPVYVVGGTTQRQSSRPVRVPAYSLAELDGRHGPFSALIVDIEGSELEIFTASTEHLKRYRLVIAELHPWAIGDNGVERCRGILSAAGFHFKRRAGITEAWQREP